MENIRPLDNIYVNFNKIKCRLDSFKVMKGITKNWPDVVLFRAGIKKNINIHLKGGYKFKIDNEKDYIEFCNNNPLVSKAILNLSNIPIKYFSNYSIVEFPYKKRKVKFYVKKDKKQKMAVSLEFIKEIFFNESYKLLNVKNKTVIDVGANIGDTAIYFALNGAKHVYAFEPYPYYYKFAVDNVKLNNIDNKITVINEGCGVNNIIYLSKDSEKLYITLNKEFGGLLYTDKELNTKGIKKIKTRDLNNIINKYNIKNAVLKIDCEGCEYKLINKASANTLKKFDEIIIECHYGYKNIEK